MTSTTTTSARMMDDLGKLLRHNFRMLAEAGCKHIQIDEPLFTMSDDGEVQAAVDAINLAIEGLPDDVHVSTHICQGNYAVGKEYDGADRPPLFRHRPLQGGPGLQDRMLVLSDRTRHDASLPRACWATGRSASAPWTCRIPRSRAEKPSPPASGRIPGLRRSRPSSPAPADSIICRGRSRSASCMAMAEAKRILGGWMSRREVRNGVRTHQSRARAPELARRASPESDELLELAQEAGRLGLFEWQVQAGTVRLSPKFLALYGLTEFDGRYESWLDRIFREDRLAASVDLIEQRVRRAGARIAGRVPHRRARATAH